VIYDLKSGVSWSFGIVIPNVLLNAIGSRSACVPVKTEAVAKMSETPLKSSRRLTFAGNIVRAFPWLRGIAWRCVRPHQKRESSLTPIVIPIPISMYLLF